MSKLLTKPDANLALTGTSQPVTEGSIAPTVEGLNWLYAHEGTSYISLSFDPLFTVTSTTYTQVRSSSAPYADDLVKWPTHEAFRHVYDTPNTRCWLTLIVHGMNCTVRLRDFTTMAVPYTEVVCGATWEQAEDNSVVASLATMQGKFLMLEAKTDSGTGYISGITIIESILTDGANLPIT